jgi:hypothetical protein
MVENMNYKEVEHALQMVEVYCTKVGIEWRKIAINFKKM